ncbi:MAG: hypothetical protein OEU92_28205 [Alphaproteobacteria bacterium]|nr:hypothetical protein [Alphaproteobacteria bacterium]
MQHFFCIWIYGEVGKYLPKIAATTNPHQAWINTSSDEAFELGVQTQIEQ